MVLYNDVFIWLISSLATKLLWNCDRRYIFLKLHRPKTYISLLFGKHSKVLSWDLICVSSFATSVTLYANETDCIRNNVCKDGSLIFISCSNKFRGVARKGVGEFQELLNPPLTPRSFTMLIFRATSVWYLSLSKQL